MLVDVCRRADLRDPAVVEDGETVAHGERFLLVMRDVDEGDRELPLQLLEEELHLLAQLQVERTERLVEEENGRTVDDRARERDALPLAARELGGLALTDAWEADAIEHFARADAPLVARHPFHPQPVLDVLRDRHVGEQGVVLEDRVDVPLCGRNVRDVDALQFDGSRVRALEAGDDAQRGRLPRAGRPEEREELA